MGIPITVDAISAPPVLIKDQLYMYFGKAYFVNHHHYYHYQMRMILILLYRVAFPRLSTMFLCLVWTLTLYTALYTVMYTVLYTVLYTDLFLQGLLQPHVEPLERPDLTWVKYKKKLLLKNISVVKIWPFLYLWLAVTFCTNSSIFQTVTLVSSKYIAWNKENL